MIEVLGLFGSFMSNLSPTGQALVWVSVSGFFLYGIYRILVFAK